MVTLVTCPEAADAFSHSFPHAQLVTAAFDAARDSSKRTVPGMGDLEARVTAAAKDAMQEQQEAHRMRAWWRA